MQTFLQDIAKKVIADHKSVLGETTVIFPNRRAGLYFREHLKAQLDGPVWSPRVMSFQDFVAFQSQSQVADKLMLTHRLFQTYNKVLKSKEGFDKFYYWGQMLLKDFDDVDKYLVNAENLYTNLSRQKQLDLTFDYLDDEQKAIIQKFWQGFDQSKSEQKERFEFVWERLFKVYAEFQHGLKDEGLAYEGMQYRYVAEHVDKISFKKLEGPIVFAGFNALNLAEEKIISWLIENRQATIHWDMDAYYMNSERQEAGHFLRTYKKKNTFAQSFPEQTPDLIMDRAKKVTITGVPQHVGQAKILGQKLGALLQKQPDIDLRKVAVVLADEALLFPVLHSLPEEVTAINVTMGFPLSYAPINSLIEHILDLQRLYNEKQKVFNFKPTLALLRHPLILPHNPAEIIKLASKIERENKVFITEEDIIDLPILKTIFTPAKDRIIAYLSEILLLLHGKGEEEDNAIEVEYIHHFYQLLNRYQAILESSDQKTELMAFSRLFKQLVRTERLPFTGEPLRGLQIMGVLETRNLDFEHVFALSMNEDFFPSQGGKHSFIPYNLRKAYELPNYDQQDAIYAYLFYRLLQRPTHINLFYNTEGNDLGGEEMSRFLQQLLHESGLKITKEVLANYSNIEEPKSITIEKDHKVEQLLSRFLQTDSPPEKRLSPSALNTYLECRLRFYFRYVAGLYEKDDLEDDVDARSMGNVLHYAMEILYDDYVSERNSKQIEKTDIENLKKRTEQAAIKAFRKQFSVPDDREFFFEGKNIIAKEIVKDFMVGILALDARYVPFELVGTEKQYDLEIKFNHADKPEQVGLRGTIDRIDRKDGQVRLIDYKTGKDIHQFKEMEDIFDRENKNRNKAAFQTFYYALLYEQDKQTGEQLVPAVFNKEALFMGKDVLLEQKGKGPVLDAEQYMNPYKEHLQNLLSELFDNSVPFDQTDDDKKCQYCAYKGICGR